MGLVDESSLAATVDAVHDAAFWGRRLTKAERTEAGKWIAGRQGLPGSYAGMFAPTEQDRAEGIRLFTGERTRSGAGAAHILGEEACRALIELDVSLASIREALDRATEGMLGRLRKAEARERLLKRTPRDDSYDARRRAVAERVLARC
ncbi:MAG: hypothetical protein ACODAJ_07345 [Planctomycetota bacterium]